MTFGTKGFNILPLGQKGQPYNSFVKAGIHKTFLNKKFVNKCLLIQKGFPLMPSGPKGFTILFSGPKGFTINVF